MAFEWDDRVDRALGLTPVARHPRREMPMWLVLALVLGPSAVVMVALWWAVYGYLWLIVWVTGLLAAR